jgi:hypothetical protein
LCIFLFKIYFTTENTESLRYTEKETSPQKQIKYWQANGLSEIVRLQAGSNRTAWGFGHYWWEGACARKR